MGARANEFPREIWAKASHRPTAVARCDYSGALGGDLEQLALIATPTLEQKGLMR